MSVDEQPTLRERQAQQVAAEIRRAFLRLVNSRGPDGFTLRDVAVEAGVSERTLYRYYPGRDELVQGIQDNENAVLEARLAEIRRTLLDELSDPDTIAHVFEVFDEHRDLVRAAGLLRQSGIDRGASATRTGQARRAVEAELDLPDEAITQFVGLIRALTSSAGWMRMTEPDVGLDSQSAGHAAQWALEVLLDAARHETGPLRPKGGSR